MGGIKTSASTYRRGVPNSSSGFFFVAQANYVIPQPTRKFISNTIVATPPTPTPTPTPTIFTFSSEPLQTISSDQTLTQSSYNNRTSELISVVVGTTCMSIGTNCFLSCINLVSVTISNSVTSFGINCFKSSGFNSINIPSSVTSIGDNCFENSGLTSIEIPNSVTSLGIGCFNSSQNLSSAVLPNSIITLPNDTFGYCNSWCGWLGTVVFGRTYSSRGGIRLHGRLVGPNGGFFLFLSNSFVLLWTGGIMVCFRR